MKQEMKVIELSKFEKRRAGWGGSQPYAMAFCYPKSGPILVKGMCEEVEEYVKKKVGPCHYRMSLFQNKASRGYWMFNIEGCFLHKKKHPITDHERYELSMYNNDYTVFKECFLRKVPMRYLKELDEFLMNNSQCQNF